MTHSEINVEVSKHSLGIVSEADHTRTIIVDDFHCSPADAVFDHALDGVLKNL